MRRGRKIGGTILKISIERLNGTIGEGGTRQAIENCKESDAAPGHHHFSTY
jgi:hypothetical protein